MIANHRCIMFPITLKLVAKTDLGGSIIGIIMMKMRICLKRWSIIIIDLQQTSQAHSHQYEKVMESVKECQYYLKNLHLAYKIINTFCSDSATRLACFPYHHSRLSCYRSAMMQPFQSYTCNTHTNSAKTIFISANCLKLFKRYTLHSPHNQTKYKSTP